ncbi:MAG: hypothetical protein ABI333_17715 [bacterium]
MTLSEMITGGLTLIDEIGAFLDGMGHAERLRAVRRLSGAEMASLYHRARRAEPITREHFVPEDRPELAEVIHHGLNSLPAFRKFQKRFCRSTDDQGRSAIFGYNEGPTRLLIGPGYFVTNPTAGVPHWERRGALVIDYHLVPDGPVATGWPRVVPNFQGLQKLVFHRTRDFMRQVSSHVSIGAAYKDERPMGAYFVLCREA